MVKTSATRLKAFAFKIDLNLEELALYLQEKMGVQWHLGSKEWHGDYISVRIEETGSIIRVFQEGEGFAFDVLNKTGCSEDDFNREIDHFTAILKEKGASDFTPTEDFY